MDNFKKYTKQSLKLKNNKFNSLENEGIIISQKDKDEVILTARKTAMYMCVRDMYNDKTLDTHIHTAFISTFFTFKVCYFAFTFRTFKHNKFLLTQRFIH